MKPAADRVGCLDGRSAPTWIRSTRVVIRVAANCCSPRVGMLPRVQPELHGFHHEDTAKEAEHTATPLTRGAPVIAAPLSNLPQGSLAARIDLIGGRCRRRLGSHAVLLSRLGEGSTAWCGRSAKAVSIVRAFGDWCVAARANAGKSRRHGDRRSPIIGGPKKPNRSLPSPSHPTAGVESHRSGQRAGSRRGPNAPSSVLAARLTPRRESPMSRAPRHHGPSPPQPRGSA